MDTVKERASFTGRMLRIALAALLVVTMMPVGTGYANEGEQSAPKLLGLKLVNPKAGEVPEAPGAVEGLVYVDENGNGAYDGGEQLVSDCVVTYGAPGDTSNVVGTTKTDAQGAFSFSGIAESSYALRVAEQTIGTETYRVARDAQDPDPLEVGFAVAAQAEEIAPLAAEQDGEANGAEGAEALEAEAAGDDAAEGVEAAGQEAEAAEASDGQDVEAEDASDVQNAEASEPTYGNSISGMVWLDEDEDGVKDDAEPAVASYPAYLYANGYVITETITDDDGAYAFSNLEPGAYQVGVGAQTLDDTEYLVPIKTLQPGEDNKFDADFDTDPVVAKSDTIELGEEGAIESVDAGLRGKPQVAPLAAGDVITIDTDAYPLLDRNNLQTVLETIYASDLSKITDATILEFIGSGTIRIGQAYNAASIVYLEGLNIDTLDLSAFSGTLDTNALAYFDKITTVALGAPGAGVTSLPSRAFYGCTSLTTVSDTLENAKGISAGVIDLDRAGVTTLESGGFQFGNCLSLSAVTLGGFGTGVTSLPSYVFQYCTSLTTISDTLENAKGISAGVIDLDRAGITSIIGGNQFSYCSSLTTVTLGAAGTGVTSLSADAFRSCTSLTTVSDTLENAKGISAGVIDLAQAGITMLEIGGSQFRSCTSLTTVTLGASGTGITSLPQSVFYGCSSLTTVSDTLTNAQTISKDVIDLAQAGIATLETGGSQFLSCSSLTTVTLGEPGIGIDSLPVRVFSGCSKLTTMSDTLAHAQTVSKDVIDLARTGITTLEAGGYQFQVCRALTTVTLGKAGIGVVSLPQYVFSGCSLLSTISDTLENAQDISSGVIDLAQAGITTLETGGWQFYECSSLATVTLDSVGAGVTSLPAGVFSSCISLTTISDACDNAQTNSGVIDLAQAGITSLDTGGKQFQNCSSLTSVTLGSAGTGAASLPISVFASCASLATVSDTLDNVRGESLNLVDVDKMPVWESGGWQFDSDRQAIIYMGESLQSLVYHSVSAVSSVFVPKTNSSVTVEAGAFSSGSGSKLYVRGPHAASPTTITGEENIAPATLMYYYEVSASTDGNGTIEKSSGGFLADAIETREVLEGNLTSGNHYAEESQGLTYAITPASAGYSVDTITATVEGTETDITASCTDNGNGTWTLPGVTADTAFRVTFKSLPIVTYDDANSTGSTYLDPNTYVDGNTVTVLGYDDAGIAAAGFAEPSRGVFAHWNTAADDSGTVYQPGDTFPISGATTLYAIYGLYRVDGSVSDYIGTYMTLADAVAACQANGLGEPYTITAFGDDPDMGTSYVEIGAGYDVTLTSDSKGPYTITQQAHARHLLVRGNLAIQNIVLAGMGLTSGTNYNGGVELNFGVLDLRDGATIQNCFAYSGGAVNAQAGNLSMEEGAIVTSNTASQGGGFYVSNNCDFVMSGGEISHNAAFAFAGGLFINGSTMHMSGAAFIENNNSSGEGGGLAAFNNSVLITNEGTIRDNTARTMGGGVCLYQSEVSIADGEISGNSASIGGGVYVRSDSLLEMTGGSINGNSATGDGGGIFTDDYSYADPADATKYANISISGTAVVSGNTAGTTSVPPSNAADFTSRATNPFDGALLTNDEINYAPLAVVYDANNTSGATYIDTQRYSANDTVTTVPYATTGFVADTGKTLDYWSTNPGGVSAGGARYDVGDTFTITTSATLYAIYKDQSITLDIHYYFDGVHDDTIDDQITRDYFTSVTQSDVELGTAPSGYAIDPTTPTDPALPEIAGNLDGAPVKVNYSSLYTITEHYVDRSGNSIGIANTTQSIVRNSAYAGAAAPYVSGYAFAGDEYTAPTASTPSLTTSGNAPSIASVTGNTNVYYVYGRDAGGDEVPGPGGGGTTPDGTEDVDVVRHWVTIVLGVYVPIPLTATDTQIVNVGNSFGMTNTDAPAPSISHYTYQGFLTDQDLVSDTPDTNAPNITASVSDGNRDVYYVYTRSTYSVTYDTNGGNADGPAPDTGVFAGTHSLNSAIAPTHPGDSGEEVAFIGWSETKDTTIYAQGDPAPTTVTSITVDGNETVYAVWGYDENKNGIPDIDEYRVTYNTNGGNADGPTPEVAEDNSTHTLNSTAIPTHPGDSGNDVVFIGWTAAADSTIYAQGQVAPTTITTVNINGADETVYAAWGYDLNGNSIPDVFEFLVTYDVNGGNADGPAPEIAADNAAHALNTSGPTHTQDSGYDVVFIGWSSTADSTIYAQGDPAPATITTVSINGADETVYAVWGYDKNGNNVPDVAEYRVTYNTNGGNADGPAPEVAADNAAHALNSTTVPTHANVSGSSVVFIGWTAAADSTIYAQGEVAPTTITSVNINGADETVYAVWGYDKNGNNVPDVFEYRVTYNTNGGNTDGPDPEVAEDNATHTLNTSTVPTHAADGGVDVAFIGWAAAADSTIYAQQDGVPASVITTVYVSGADETVYALWGYDENGNGIADVYEYLVTYDTNGGNADGPAPEVAEDNAAHTLNTTTVPTHATDSGHAVLFLGWSDTQDMTIFDRTNSAPSTITSIPINGADETVYALWGYDTNGNNIPDVTETRYTLDYDENGGTGSVPSATDLLEGDSVTLDGGAGLGHAQQGGVDVVFAGWTQDASAAGEVYDRSDIGGAPALEGATLTIGTSDVTVYAVWSLDANGNTIPDAYEDTYTVDYNPSTGTGLIAPHTDLIEGDVVTLDDGSTLTPPGAALVDVLFVGWTQDSSAETKTYTRLDKGSTPIMEGSTYTVGTSDATMYAVWSLDENDNNIPDAFEDVYILDYDINGGNTAAPGSVTDLLEDDMVTLHDGTGLTHAQQGGIDVIFIGWTQDAAAVGVIYDQGGTLPSMEGTTLSMPAANTTLYAVWGYDRNGNTVPDVTEQDYTLTYDLGAGTGTAAPVTDLLEDDVVTLHDGTGLSHAQVSGVDVIFIGWTQDSTLSAVYDQGNTLPAMEGTTLTMPAANVTLYAVWGYDRNGNNIPDVTETTYTLTYDLGTGAGTANPVTDLLEDDVVTLHDGTGLTHAQVGGVDVLFAGWTTDASAAGTVYSHTSIVPARITTYTMTASNATVYAVWSYDTNGNTVPDIDENSYTLTYDANGGSGGPGQDTDLLSQTGYSLKTTPAPTHAADVVTGAPVVFAGWTLSPDATLYDRTSATGPSVVTSVDISNDMSVYAAWSLDENGNSIPDVDEPKYTVDYDENGGNGTNPVAADANVLAGSHTLNATDKPKHDDDGGVAVVFIGWTETADSTIYAKTDNAPSTVTTITVSGDTTVFAVWGYDENGNNIPDVIEAAYTLAYDINGGVANSGPVTETNVLTGNHTLATSPVPTHDPVSGVDVALIGWTENLDTTLYAKGDTLVEPAVTSLYISADTTVYAQWGLDENKNNIPDVLETLYTVDYDDNGGDGLNVPAPDTGVLAGPHILKTAPVPTHAPAFYPVTSVNETVVFIGWSTAVDTHIYDKNDTAPAYYTSITVSDDTTVYALWGFDEDHTGVADVLEAHYFVDYDVNGGITGSGPTREAGILNANHPLLAVPVPQHSQVGGMNVAFIGWTETADSTIYSKGDTLAVAAVTEISVLTDREVYAQWGYDVNKNDIPDVLETLYTVDYDDNGGDGLNVPAPDTGVLAGPHILNSSTVPTHAADNGEDVAFIGWTLTQDTTIYAKTDNAPTTYTSITVADDETVYAVWGYDENKNNIPDVKEPKYTLVYDANGGTGGPGSESQLLAQTNYTLAQAPKPTHDAVGGVAVVFAGWTLSADPTIYDRTSPTPPSVVTGADIPTNLTVYAAWSLDTNDNNIPDVTETRYTLDYDENGGTGSVPSATDLLEGDSVTLDGGAGLGHAQQGGVDVVFAGWTQDASAAGEVYDRSDIGGAPALEGATLTIGTSDVTVYAVWSLDANGNTIPDAYEDTYTLSYNLGVGTGTANPVTDLLEDDVVTLHDGTGLTHGQVGGVDVVFVGWTQDSTLSAVYDQGETLPAMEGATLSMPAADTTLYAVWGYDRNGNNIPDVTETTYTLDYDLGAGTGTAAPVTDLLVGDVVTLHDGTGLSHTQIGGVDVVFVGWTQDSALSAVYDQGNALPAMEGATLTMPAADTTLYAVWGYDRNGNTIPDVTETTYDLVYDVNGGDAGTGPVTANLIDGTYPLDSMTTPTYTTLPSDPDILFMGWTAQAESILEAGDTIPATMTQATISGADVTVFALWGYDRNGNNIPDVTETTYTVTYHVVDKSGTAISGITAPAPEVNKLAGTSYGISAAPSGLAVKMVYIGWGENTYVSPTPAATPIAGTVSGDIDVYLVYGNDNNGDGIEDFTVTVSHVTQGDGGKIVADEQVYVNIGDPFTGTALSDPRYTLADVLWDSVSAGAVSPYVENNIQGDHTIVFEYTPNSYPVTVAYEYKDGTALSGVNQDTFVLHGSPFAPTVPAFPDMTLIGWTLNGVAQAGAPSIASVTQYADIVLVYGQDKTGDGLEDFTVTEEFYDAGGSVAADGQVHVNKGETYAAVPKAITGYDYANSHQIDGGSTLSGIPTIANVQSDHTVRMLYATSVYTITDRAVDESGNVIAGYGSSSSYAHGQSYSGTVWSIPNYQYQGYRIGSGPLATGTPSIGSVTSSATVSLVYRSTSVVPNPPAPSYENYEFVKKPNVKNVAAGEYVTYTFSGFGNKWPFDIERFTISDKPDRGLDFKNASIPAFANGAGVTYDIHCFTSDGAEQVLYSNVSAASPFYFEAPALAQDVYITAITLSFGTVPSGFAVGDTMQWTFKVWDNPPANTLTNVGILSYKVGDEYKEYVTGDSGTITIGGWFMNLPQTGDAMVVLPLAVLAVGAISLLALVLYKRRRSFAHEREAAAPGKHVRKR